MSNVRYIWDFNDARKIYKDIPLEAKGVINLPYSEDKIFVNILSVYAKGAFNTYYKVKLFYADGKTFEGWTWDGCMPIKLFNQEELFDGRFNS